MKELPKITEITIDMPEKQRAKLLKEKELFVVECDRTKIENATLDELAKATRSDALPLLKKLAQEFGAFGEFTNNDIEIDFYFGSKALHESTFKQGRRFDDYALMLTNFNGVVSNAIGIEAHRNRYNNRDPNLRCVCVLVGAFSDGERICPVKLEIKHFNKNANDILHIAVTKTDIKKAKVCAGRIRRQHHGNKATRLATISLYQLARKCNPADGDLLKYFPDKMLTRAQRRSKQTALRNQEKYIEEKQNRKKAAKQNPKLRASNKDDSGK